MPIDNHPLSICIVSHNAYGAIAGGSKGFIGGVEWQTSLLARWLAAQGHRVSLITWDEGGSKEETIADVRILKVCRPTDGLPGLRFFHPKWTSLVQALRRADADVYYHNCSECVTGQVALWCRQHGRAFVFSAASDADCDPRLPELHSFRERFLYRLGLRRAHRVIAQTTTQQRRFQEVFGVEAEAIPMPCPGPEAAEFRPPDVAARRVLWIGRVCQVKRPDLFLDLAEQTPELVFDLVGPFFDDPYSQSIRERAGRISNVVVHGRIAKNQVGEYYQRASFLCCTSDYEGFPNTFLEAWSFGLPIVSTVDPDGLITARTLGTVTRDLAAMRQAFFTLSASPSTYQEVSARVRRYYEENHTLQAVMPRIELVLRQACSDPTRTRSPQTASHPA